MPTIANEPRITVIVVVERNGCVTVSVCVQRERDCKPIVLLDKEPARDVEEAHEIAREKVGMCDAKINELLI